MLNAILGNMFLDDIQSDTIVIYYEISWIH